MRGRKSKLPNAMNAYDFGALAKREPNARVRIRLMGLAHLQEGNTITATAKMCRVQLCTIHDWLYRFKHGGIEALQDQQGQGRKPKLPKDQHQVFKIEVLELQNNRPGGRVKGLDVLKLMEEKLGIKCSLDTVYRTLARVNLVWISARSKHPKTDFLAQETFKKTSEKK